MLQTDITILKQREKVLEKEIDEALSHTSIDDPMIAHLKSRILYLKEEIDRLRHEAFCFVSLSDDVMFGGSCNLATSRDDLIIST